MIDQTNAFKILKVEQQRILDFSKLLCYSVPTLKKAIKGYKEKVKNYENFVKPEYFIEEVDIDRIGELAKHYKENMSKYILISSFSFFESYFKDVVKEMLEFHGGLDKFIAHVHNRQKTILQGYSSEMLSKKKNLQTVFKKRKWQKYKNILDDLESEKNYRHPSELFSAYGIKSFFETILSKNFKSVMIPDFLEIGLGLNLSEKINRHSKFIDKDLKETFDAMRELRNGIGHGNAPTLNFDEVMELIRFLRYLSVKVDNHIVDNFLVIEEYN